MAQPGELARESAVILASPGWESLLVSGPERRSWLEGLVTCQVGHLEPSQGSWGLFLNRQGKIQSVLWVVAAPEALWLAVAPGTLASVEQELGRMLIMEDAELERPSSPQSWFALHGPEAPARARALAQRFSGHAGAIDWSGLGGAALVVPSPAAPGVLAEAGESLLSPEDWLRLRLERGLPEFGTDFDSRDRPHEAALERRAVSWTKGCYLGQEVVCMQDMRGKVKRSVRLLQVSAPPDAALGPGAEIANARGEPVGKATSAAYSARAGGWLLLARVDLDALAAAIAAGAGAELRCGPTGEWPWPARSADPV